MPWIKLLRRYTVIRSDLTRRPEQSHMREKADIVFLETRGSQHPVKPPEIFWIYSKDCTIRQQIVFGWNFIFNADVSPLRHIPDNKRRHLVLQALGFMWAVSFGIALGSYTVLAISVLGHAVLIGAAAVTVATYTAAATKPHLFMRGSGRRRDGEHD